ncbi:MAG: hypothetical protein SGI92_23610 [Bryobacteraceae bacterium]|nr:hypothetical protein [Bryobacteraceae bacterium]
MSLPDSIRVRIFSESVESVGITPVVSQLMVTRELASTILAVTGMNPDRVREILARGSFVSGASRFKWEKFEPAAAEVEAMLATFPAPDPTRPFDPAMCSAVVMNGLARPLAIEREAGSRKRLFRRESFWDRLMTTAAGLAQYKTYSYKERADVYMGVLDEAAAVRLQDAAKLLTWSTYEQQIRRGTVRSMELHVPRTTSG